MRRRRETGQALVETLAALLLLVPMVLAIQAIADVQGAASLSTQAVRLLSLGSALQGRTLHANDLIAQAPALLAAERAPGVWRGSLAYQREPRLATEATRVVAAALAPAELISGRRLPLERNGWLFAQAQISIESPPLLSAVLGPAPLLTASRMALLSEDFQAQGRDEVRQRVSTLDAMRPLRRTVSALRPLTALLSVFDPPFRRLCTQVPDPDVLPADRLTFLSPQPAVGCP